MTDNLTNAQEEFIEHTDDKDVLCAIVTNMYYANDEDVTYKLPLHYTENQLIDFFNQLNFDYYSGYGSQYLSGTIWYTDGTWSTRAEYDGSEWWEHHTCPLIPADL